MTVQKDVPQQNPANSGQKPQAYITSQEVNLVLCEWINGGDLYAHVEWRKFKKKIT